jgi:hypothetical protein
MDLPVAMLPVRPMRAWLKGKGEGGAGRCG